jgi:hypothetical protein
MLTLVSLVLLSAGAMPVDPDYDRPPVPSTAPITFAYADITIDPAGTPLAAYQVEFTGDANRVKLVGIEGGDAAAFKNPPYYDPAALNHHRVILAAFNTGADLPKQAFRAVRLHLQITGTETPKCQVKLIVAAAADGLKIPAASASVTPPQSAAPAPASPEGADR